MSVESAIEYIKRMRNDDAFRQTINGFDGDEGAWAHLKEQGYEFTMEEFKHAQDAIYQEYGVTPM